MKEVDRSDELAERLFDGLVQIDLRGRISFWNQAAERITGYSANAIIGMPYQQQPARHVSEGGNDLPDALVPLLMTVKDGLAREALAYLNHADGYRLTTITRTAPLWDKKRRICGGLELFNDNKALIASFHAVQKTEETILFDPLTGIGNRAHIETKIRSAMEDFHAQRCPFGILFVDVDNFKDFNDQYGHMLGDKVLRMAANTLRQNLRMSDSCGRWGGEEFIALVYDLDSDGLAKVAEKLRHAVAHMKVREKDLELGVTISIGSTLVRPGDTFVSLVERADQLMYESKRHGRNRVTIGD
jgi:diguanylate cyclase (GGDEF)-like protein